ncbi:MAG: ATP-binding cassette domain-containing protein [Bacteroidetes bacterium]|nr:ATP-binding cassette domain-containing protein [Bacteroidota bacterium]
MSESYARATQNPYAIEDMKKFCNELAAKTRNFELEKQKNKMLQVQNLSIVFGRSSVLVENATFTLRPKDRVALVGKNGAGKSTLMKAIEMSKCWKRAIFRNLAIILSVF